MLNSMKICYLIPLLVGILILTSCTTFDSKELPFRTEQSNYSANYNLPAFKDSARLQKIRQALPRLDEIFKQHAEDNNYPGFAYGVVVGDSLLLSGSMGTIRRESDIKVTDRSLFRVASLTKSFTAMAVLKLRDEGELRLSDPVSKYISEFENLQYLTRDAPSITIKNLLTMTSGFPEDNPWADQQLEISSKEFTKLIKERFSFSSTPDLNYEYSNLGYALLGRIISEVTGQSYQKYISREILAALDMKDTFWEYSKTPKDKLVIGYRWEDEEWVEEDMLHDGAFGPIGGLITSIEDYAKYVAFHLSAWPPRNEPNVGPVNRSSIREMHLVHSPVRLYANVKDADGQPCPTISGYGYGLGIFENCNGVKRINHSGGLPGYGTEYRFYPHYGIGIISFASKTYASVGAVNEGIFATLSELAELNPRKIQVSEILAIRKDQVVELINTWNSNLADSILADNFFKDKSQYLRRREADKIINEAGKILSKGELIPQNQLRGKFMLSGENADIEITFSLSPEANPKVQRLNLRLIEKDNS